jgi:nucleoside-diphosphate-sugar epimerase
VTPPLLPAPDVTIVTGAAGWLGRSILAAFAETGGPWARAGEVRALVREREEAEAIGAAWPSVRPVVGDVSRPDSLHDLFDGVNGSVDVLHAAGLIHPRRIAELFDVNAGGTRTMLRMAQAAGARRFVYVSSNSPFGVNSHRRDRFRNDEPYDPYYAYGRSKMEAELAVLDAAEHGLDAVIVRPPWFYGPHQPQRQTTFFRMVRTGRFPVFGAGDQMRSMVYVGNLVQGILRAELVATDPGRGWWIADARPYSVAEIVATVARALADEGLEVTPNRIRLPEVVSRAAELADALIQRTGRYNQQLHVLGEMGKTIACEIDAARTELGYEPDVELYEGMRTSIRWCLDQGMAL